MKEQMPNNARRGLDWISFRVKTRVVCMRLYLDAYEKVFAMLKSMNMSVANLRRTSMSNVKCLVYFHVES